MSLPPGPPLPAPIQTLLWIARPTQYMDACRERYGDIFTLRFTGLGVSQRIVFIADPEGVRSVFGGDPSLLRAGSANVALSALLGEQSLLLLDGPEHLRQRKLMLPPFHGERMRAYEAVMRDITLERIRRWPRDRVFPLLPEMQRITLEVILRTVFGFDHPAARDEMRALLQRMLLLGSGTARVALLAFAQHELRGFSPWGRFVAAKRDVLRALQAQIERRRAEPAGSTGDILSLLISARDENGSPLSDAELQDELMTLLIAGHETTATALGWAFDLLLHHPEALQRSFTAVAADDTHYIDAVVKETLRIRPVVPIVARYLHGPFRVLGHELPAGTVAAPCIYLTQRRPDVYPRPDQFLPERFLDGGPDSYAWIPFGGGIRRCLGASFAQVEMRVVLQTVLGSLQLKAAEASLDSTTRRAVTLVPRHGVRVRVGPTRPAPQPAPQPDGSHSCTSAPRAPGARTRPPASVPSPHR